MQRQRSSAYRLTNGLLQEKPQNPPRPPRQQHLEDSMRSLCVKEQFGNSNRNRRSNSSSSTSTRCSSCLSGIKPRKIYPEIMLRRSRRTKTAVVFLLLLLKLLRYTLQTLLLVCHADGLLVHNENKRCFPHAIFPLFGDSY